MPKRVSRKQCSAREFYETYAGCGVYALGLWWYGQVLELVAFELVAFPYLCLLAYRYLRGSNG